MSEDSDYARGLAQGMALGVLGAILLVLAGLHGADMSPAEHLERCREMIDASRP